MKYNCISSFWFQELNLVLHFFLLNAKKRCNWASVSGFWSCCGASVCPAMPKPFLRVTVKVGSHSGFWVQRHWLEYFWSSCSFKGIARRAEVINQPQQVKSSLNVQVWVELVEDFSSLSFAELLFGLLSYYLVFLGWPGWGSRRGFVAVTILPLLTWVGASPVRSVPLVLATEQCSHFKLIFWTTKQDRCVWPLSEAQILNLCWEFSRLAW